MEVGRDEVEMEDIEREWVRRMWERRKRLNDQQMKTMVNIAESKVRTLSCQAAITVSAACSC